MWLRGVDRDGGYLNWDSWLWHVSVKSMWALEGAERTCVSEEVHFTSCYIVV